MNELLLDLCDSQIRKLEKKRVWCVFICKMTEAVQQEKEINLTDEFLEKAGIPYVYKSELELLSKKSEWAVPKNNSQNLVEVIKTFECWMPVGSYDALS